MVRKLAVVGATGAVGQIVLEEIQHQKLAYDELKLLASERSAGKKVKVGDQELTVELLEPGAFDGIDLVIASTPDE
ncbi:MAG: aspartate-semialdehyde dehydrogenase, partial [Planctomycetota bacterium]